MTAQDESRAFVPPVGGIAYARAGLVGNPSDGYFGRTISVEIRQYRAFVRLYPCDRLQIQTGGKPLFSAASAGELRRLASESGYCGESRLLQATVSRFCEHCRSRGIDIRPATFALDYITDIPRGVGLAGSSALVVAASRAMMQHFGVALEPWAVANLALAVETEELGIAAGLQDRVVQALGGCVYMDFARGLMEQRGHGDYRTVDPSLLPPLFVAWNPEFARDSDDTHRVLRERWDGGDPEVLDAMREFAELAEQAHELLLAGNGAEIGPLMDRNFDLRARICDVGEGNRELVGRARKAGAHAKLAGSGGAIVGTLPGEDTWQALTDALPDPVRLVRIQQPV